jgi:hypothetical protein
MLPETCWYVLCSCFGMWNSCPKFVRIFQLHSVCVYIPDCDECKARLLSLLHVQGTVLSPATSLRLPWRSANYVRYPVVCVLQHDAKTNGSRPRKFGGLSRRTVPNKSETSTYSCVMAMWRHTSLRKWFATNELKTSISTADYTRAAVLLTFILRLVQTLSMIILKVCPFITVQVCNNVLV